MIELCYAAISGVKEFFITQGQALIIGTGLTLGLLYAIRQRRRTKAQRYLDREMEPSE